VPQQGTVVFCQKRDRKSSHGSSCECLRRLGNRKITFSTGFPHKSGFWSELDGVKKCILWTGFFRSLKENDSRCTEPKLFRMMVFMQQRSMDLDSSSTTWKTSHKMFMVMKIRASYSEVDMIQVTQHGYVEAYGWWIQEDDSVCWIEEVNCINIFAQKDRTSLAWNCYNLDYWICGMRYGEIGHFHRHEDGFAPWKSAISMAKCDLNRVVLILDSMGKSDWSWSWVFSWELPGPKQ